MRILILALLATLPAAAQWRKFGQEQVRPSWWFGGGFASPINPIGARLDTGWAISGGGGITSKYFGVNLDANLTSFGIAAPPGTQRYWSVTLDPIFHVNQRGPVDFYVTGGGGIYSQITEFRHGDNTIYKPGVNGGAGFAVNIAGRRYRLKLFTEARFHHMFIGPSGASYIPVTIGLRY
jgi:Outer membrane protein beta-barrel domain